MLNLSLLADQIDHLECVTFRVVIGVQQSDLVGAINEKELFYYLFLLLLRNEFQHLRLDCQSRAILLFNQVLFVYFGTAYLFICGKINFYVDLKGLVYHDKDKHLFDELRSYFGDLFVLVDAALLFFKNLDSRRQIQDLLGCKSFLSLILWHFLFK